MWPARGGGGGDEGEEGEVDNQVEVVVALLQPEVDKMLSTSQLLMTREEMMEVKLRLGKDEKRAREGGIMLSVKVVVLDDTAFSIVDVSKSINRLPCNY